MVERGAERAEDQESPSRDPVRAVAGSLCAVGMAFHTQRVQAERVRGAASDFLQQRITCSLCHLLALCP